MWREDVAVRRRTIIIERSHDSDVLEDDGGVLS